MHLVQILLPLFDNQGNSLASSLFAEVETELTERFGGITSFTRAPARGKWKEQDNRTRDDEIVVVEVMSKELDRAWWAAYRGSLKRRFAQEVIIIRPQHIELI